MDGQTTITVNGKAVGLRFNYQAVIEMGAVKGTSTLVKNVISIIWGGITGYAFMKQQDPAVSFEEVCEWYEDINLKGDDDEQLKAVLQAFESSKVFNEKLKPEIEKVQAEEAAKKNEATETSSAT